MAIDVFMSVGRTATEQQEAFVTEVERLLREHDLRPRNLGRLDYSSVQPLRAVEELMDECRGTIVIAFERLYVERGLKRRGGADASSVEDTALPTVWNQIEAAMAYVKRQPLLVIVEQKLLSEGLLETGYDWYVQYLPIDPTAVRTPEVQGRLTDWKRRVEKHEPGGPSSARLATDPSTMTIAQLLGALRPAQLYALLSGAVGLLTAAVLLGRQLG